MKRFRRGGLSVVEALLAVVVVTTLAGMAATAVWGSSRQGRALDLRERLFASATGRLEMVTALPLHRRPVAGTYTAENAEAGSDLERVLAPQDLGGVAFTFELEVEERPVEYPDYFFGGGSVRHIDFRAYRLRAKGGDLTSELVTLK